ncbi:MAG TPA: CCA tRNA nucleotidyltransferase [Mycobacteriales bacterium]
MVTIDLRAPRDASETAVTQLIDVPKTAIRLGEAFAAGGFALHLVGGSVRDLLLGRTAATPDLDFTTDARPADIQRLARPLAGEQWDVGIAFGTVGLLVDGVRCEVTTYRSEEYDVASRNPNVTFGDTLVGDLLRRDFTVNAMAVTVPDLVFHDPYGGLVDLAAGRLRTPAPAVESFSDDPLRMLRAARFTAQLGLQPDDAVLAAMGTLAPRLSIVAAERIRDELTSLLLAADPVGGLELLVDTGLADVVLPELPALRLSIDEHHQHKDVYRHTLTVLEQAIELEHRLPGGGPDLVVRLAALLHDIGKPATKKALPGGRVSFIGHDVEGSALARARLRALRFPKDVVTAVSRLVFLHLRFHGYGEGAWTDAAVRRYVRDAGAELERLHVLTRSDCTTRNQRKAARLAAAYDDLEARIGELAAAEDLARVRPDIDGNRVMELLGIGPGPDVGRAARHLLAWRLDEGPHEEQAAIGELVRWAEASGIPVPAATRRLVAGDEPGI